MIFLSFIKPLANKSSLTSIDYSRLEEKKKKKAQNSLYEYNFDSKTIQEHESRIIGQFHYDHKCKNPKKKSY